LINDQIDCRLKEPIAAKGFSRPVRAYEVKLGTENGIDAAIMGI
jgi:class 3 adenylate cyclase